MPDKRSYRLKLRGLAHANEWAALWELSNAKRVSLPPSAFADACLEQGRRDEAARYAARMAPAEAVPLLLKCERLEAARAIAVGHKEKQPELLRMVSSHAADH